MWWQEILVWVFCSTFWAFLCTSQAPVGRSLWSGHHWIDLLFLQKLSIDDANFGQKWWRQKWKKGQGSSQPVTAGMGVNGLSQSKQKKSYFTFSDTMTLITHNASLKSRYEVQEVFFKVWKIRPLCIMEIIFRYVCGGWRITYCRLTCFGGQTDFMHACVRRCYL